MSNLILALIGILGIMALCSTIGVIRVWKEVEEDEAKGY